MCQGASLQPVVDGLPARDQVDVDRLHLLAGDQAQRRVARGGDEVEAALVHQRDHLVGGGGRLDVDLAAGLLLEVGDPVIGLVGLAALDVAGPGDDIDLAFALADGFGHLGKRGAAKGKQSDGRCCRTFIVGFILFVSSNEIRLPQTRRERPQIFRILGLDRARNPPINHEEC